MKIWNKAWHEKYWVFFRVKARPRPNTLLGF